MVAVSQGMMPLTQYPLASAYNIKSNMIALIYFFGGELKILYGSILDIGMANALFDDKPLPRSG